MTDPTSFFTPSLSSALGRVSHYKDAIAEIIYNIRSHGTYVRWALASAPGDLVYESVLYNGRLYPLGYTQTAVHSAVPLPRNDQFRNYLDFWLDFTSAELWYRGQANDVTQTQFMQMFPKTGFNTWSVAFSGLEPRFAAADVYTIHQIAEIIYYDRTDYDFQTNVSPTVEFLADEEQEQQDSTDTFEYAPGFHLAYWGNASFNVPDGFMIDAEYTNKLNPIYPGWLVLIEQQSSAGGQFGAAKVIYFQNHYFSLLEVRSRQYYQQHGDHVWPTYREWLVLRSKLKTAVPELNRVYDLAAKYKLPGLLNATQFIAHCKYIYGVDILVYSPEGARNQQFSEFTSRGEDQGKMPFGRGTELKTGMNKYAESPSSESSATRIGGRRRRFNPYYQGF